MPLDALSAPFPQLLAETGGLSARCPGIPVEVQRQLFEGMVRGDRRRTKQNSGLGLYICKLILDAMGGSIRFETNETSGTTFIVGLPSI